MALKEVAELTGLWRDPGWHPGMPGVYALVVGISTYPHLEGGTGPPASDPFEMGQLVSSASTAAALFAWLRRDFRHHDLPVVWCMLLLSPTAQEKARFDAMGLLHYGTPHNDGLRKAIKHWTGQVPGHKPEHAQAAQNSRTLFFFSGHGVASNWRPLLLPSDYLDPAFGAPQLENCISVRELQEWMEQSPVGEHLALIDACQNQFSPLASKGATADACFPVHPAGGSVPRTAVALFSTSPNAVAYQVAGRDYTFFGDAVLEALRGIAGGNDTRLEFRELVDYVKPRVNELLKQAGGTALTQTVRQRIEGDDVMVITEIAPAVPAAAGARPAALEGMRAGRARPAATPRPLPVDTAVVLRADAARFDATLAVPDAIALDAMQRDFGEIYRRFGHEYASHPWRDGMALVALSDGARIESGGAVVRNVQRDEPSSRVQVDLLLGPRSGGVLLVFEGAQYVQRERLAVTLPTDVDGRVPIRLSLAFGSGTVDGPHKLLSLEARLGPSDDSPHYQYLWELTREADLGSLRVAAERADPKRLVQAAQDKLRAQVAATAGMLLLARAGRIGDVKHWTRNLMQWFEDMPDGAVLWAESLHHALEQGDSTPFGVVDPVAEMARVLENLEQRGLPFFADAAELAESLLRYVLRQLPKEDARARLQAVQQRLEDLFQVAMPGGHFIVLTGLPRPAKPDWLGKGTGPITVPEMRALLGRSAPL